MLPDALETISACLQYKAHFAGSTAELNYLDIFEDNFLNLWVTIAHMMHSVKHEPTIHFFLNSNSTFTLLQRVTDYLRKELKVPTYSGMFSSDLEFSEDTERLFRESANNRLETKISKVKLAFELLFETIESTEQIKVSFTVFEGIKQLARSDIHSYRGLRVLQEIKSNFIATFADEESHLTQ